MLLDVEYQIHESSHRNVIDRKLLTKGTKSNIALTYLPVERYCHYLHLYSPFC